MKLNLIPIILDAQKQLLLHPFDLAHDIQHHYRVYENCINIIVGEKLNVDKELVTICAWYHDLGGRRGENSKLINEILSKNINDNKINNIIIKIIQEHSYGEKQTSVESMILFDADKLEYVNPFRLYWFKECYKSGLISKQVHDKYQKEWHDRVPKVKTQLNFNYSKVEFTKFFEFAKEIMESN